MVLFLHNTSRVDDEPYPRLLQDKGFGGFPSLAFMDAEGEVIASPTSRSVSAFNSTLTAVESYLELKARADGGDKSVANALFVAEMGFDKLDFDEATARFAKLRGFTADEKKTIESQIVGLEFTSMISEVRQLGLGQEAARKRAADMAKAGRAPSGQMAGQFWTYCLRHADSDEDGKLYEESLTHLKKIYADNPRFQADLPDLETRLKELTGG